VKKIFLNILIMNIKNQKIEMLNEFIFDIFCKSYIYL
jgi:hypothetical protein